MKDEKTEVKSGSRFSRSCLARLGVNVSEWPAIETRMLPTAIQNATNNRIAAIKAYMQDDVSVDEIESKFSVPRVSFFRMLKNCLKFDQDGILIGFRAAIPYIRTKNYCRSKAVVSMDGGAAKGDAGAFQQLLKKYPLLDQWVNAHARVYKVRGKGGQPFNELHTAFIATCKLAGIAEHEYPLNRKGQAAGALKSSIVKQHHKMMADVEKNNADKKEKEHFPPQAALDEVQMDGHKMDIRLVVKEQDAYGGEVIYEVLRAWIIVVIDSFTRCILGYSIVLGHNYDHIDVLQAIFNALAPHRPPANVIENAQYDKSGGFPSADANGYAWATWLTIKLDNAMAHKALHIQDVLHNKINCVSDFGPPHQPNDRSIAERLFLYLVQNFSHRMVGTTGHNSQDEIIKRLSPRRKDGLSILMSLDELKEITDIVISDYNGRPHSGIQGYSPLALFKHSMAQRKLPLNTIQEAFRCEAEFVKEIIPAKIHSEAKYGGAYVNFCYLKYRNTNVLRSDSVDSDMFIAFDRRDVSKIELYTSSGMYLGILTPPYPWCEQPHSMYVQAEIFKAVKKGQLEFRIGEGIHEAYRRHKLKDSAVTRKLATTNHKHTGRVKNYEPPKEGFDGNYPAESVKPIILKKGFIY